MGKKLGYATGTTLAIAAHEKWEFPGVEGLWVVREKGAWSTGGRRTIKMKNPKGIRSKRVWGEGGLDSKKKKIRESC